MIDHRFSDLRFTPARIALVYVAVGGAWILVSDTVVQVVAPTQRIQRRLQTIKGGLFVAGSGALVYVLVAHRQRELERSNQRLDTALQQVRILHRVLRHNLRNICTILQGCMARVQAEGSENADFDVETAREQVDRLVEISEKSKRLRKVMLAETCTESIEPGELVERTVAEARAEYPEATFELDVRDAVAVEAPERLATALAELVENAVEHHEDGDPTVWITVEQRSREAVTIEVADDGPGLPEMERRVLERGVEDPLHHSEGLGLWLVRSIVVGADGSVEVDRNEPRGTVVRIRLPVAVDADTGD